jgi:hypothetical protein
MSEEMTPERLEATRGRYCRILVANHDVLEARGYVRELLQTLQADQRPSPIGSALLTAFVISYGRCFTQSEWSPEKKAVLLPDSAIAEFTDEERALHKRVVSLRMQEFAHSDVTAADVSVSAYGDSTLVPTSRVMRHYSLDRSDVELASVMLEKLVLYVTRELIRLQQQLAPHGSWQPPRPPAAA